jgi:hypothetical protein
MWGAKKSAPIIAYKTVAYRNEWRRGRDLNPR